MSFTTSLSLFIIFKPNNHPRNLAIHSFMSSMADPAGGLGGDPEVDPGGDPEVDPDPEPAGGTVILKYVKQFSISTTVIFLFVDNQLISSLVGAFLSLTTLSNQF